MSPRTGRDHEGLPGDGVPQGQGRLVRVGMRIAENAHRSGAEQKGRGLRDPQTYPTLGQDAAEVAVGEKYDRASEHSVAAPPQLPV